jgi:hypothetical protein
LFRQRPSRFGEADSATVRLQQHHADPRLKSADGSLNRWDAGVESFGRLAEMLRPRELDEDLEFSKGDVPVVHQFRRRRATDMGRAVVIRFVVKLLSAQSKAQRWPNV